MSKVFENEQRISAKCCLILFLYRFTINVVETGLKLIGLRGALTSSRTCSYDGGGELGIVCSFLIGKQFLSVSAWSSSVNSSVPEGNDWLICRCCSSDSTLLLRLSPELRDFSIFEKRSLNGASLTSFFVPVVCEKGNSFHLQDRSRRERIFFLSIDQRWRCNKK